MLEYDGDTKDFEEAFMATFQVSYSDVFGSLHTHDLKESGDHIPVTKDNRQVSSSQRHLLPTVQFYSVQWANVSA